ncbi:MAG TPA: choice-of-anchor tandem repeat GloVer-containing protein [Rhizomicrobium sp.]|nr:choice-of-anchor tandem repeat GloVer-containing protein [Rhizomicrobium sp.]
MAAFACALCASPASAYTFQVIHNFTGGSDGAAPPYTLVRERQGFLGTSSSGGKTGNGTVFDLKQNASGWTVRPVYNFGDTDGAPGWGVTRFNGSLYVNAFYAEVMDGPCGSALQVNRSSGGHGYQGVLMHTYVKKQDGCPTGNLVLDSAGNVYGVTQDGGANGWGSIFELSNSGNSWTQTILYSFPGASGGGAPYSAPVFDQAGNLYGTATAGGNQGCGQGCGTVYELSPGKSGWSYSVLYSFTGGNDGGQPTAGLVFDKAGNLYGAAESYGANGGGTVFELSPSGNTWSFNLLTALPGTGGPVVSLTLDGTHNIYGTSFFGTSGYGAVFRLTQANGSWRYRDLHDFTGGSDGGYPGGGVTRDASGNLYGTAVLGGTDNGGVIYELAK